MITSPIFCASYAAFRRRLINRPPITITAISTPLTTGKALLVSVGGTPVAGKLMRFTTRMVADEVSVRPGPSLYVSTTVFVMSTGGTMSPRTRVVIVMVTTCPGFRVPMKKMTVLPVIWKVPCWVVAEFTMNASDGI